MRLVLDGVRAWRHDLAGCLHACAATLFDFAGISPLDALGSGWSFHYRPGDARREEYYFPAPPGASLFEAIAPHHGATSRWRSPDPDDGAAWRDVRDRVLGGRPTIVAVDNYHLPFRPAYGDVHSNHLAIVYGFDDEAKTARVLDAVPPRFDGDVPIATLAAARASGNPVEHARDQFFTRTPIERRWLDVAIRPGPRRLDRDAARAAIARNLSRFAGADGGAPSDARSGMNGAPRAYDGLDGQARFLADMADRIDAGDDVVDELFVVAGTALAAAGVHGDFIGRLGRETDSAELREAGRAVDRVAHHWAALRIIAGRARGDGARSGAASLRRRARALQRDHEHALGDLAHAMSGL